MTLSVLYWVMMLLWALFGVFPFFPRGEERNWHPFGGSLLLFILLALVGWKVFGSPLRG